MKTSNELNAAEKSVNKQSQAFTLTRPNVDLFESEDHYSLLVEMPGVDQSTVNVTLDKDVLLIEGHSNLEKPEGYHLISGDLGQRKYQRSFRLSDDIHRGGIDAVVKNGVLQLTLAKSPESKSQKISVRQG